MEYQDFTKDFIRRTQANLKKYNGKYDVTNLINSCLGLIIIPNQFYVENLPDYNFTESDKKAYGINRLNITYELNDNYSLCQTAKHIRNGISHARIQQVSSIYNKIVKLKISDSFTRNGPDNFSIEITPYELMRFSIKISNEFLKL